MKPAFKPRLMSGRPFRGKLTKLPRPTPALLMHEQATLVAIRAGHAGLEIGADFPLALAIKLELMGLVIITRVAPQRAIARKAA